MNEASRTVLIGNDAAVLGLLAMILGFVFWGASRERGFWKKFYAVVPAILPCYLLPAIANSFGLIDGAGSGLYPMARDYLLRWCCSACRWTSRASCGWGRRRW